MDTKIVKREDSGVYVPKLEACGRGVNTFCGPTIENKVIYMKVGKVVQCNMKLCFSMYSVNTTSEMEAVFSVDLPFDISDNLLHFVFVGPVKEYIKKVDVRAFEMNKIQVYVLYVPKSEDRCYNIQVDDLKISIMYQCGQ